MSSIAVSLSQNSDTESPLRVCIVTETYSPEVNGVAITTAYLVNGLLSLGHRVQLIRPRQKAGDTPRREGHLEIVPQRGMVIPFYRDLKLGLPAGRALERLWQQALPSIIHIETEGPLGRSALGSALRLNLPISSSFHTNFHSYSRHYGLGFLARPIVTYLKRFHNRTACTLVPTEELANQLQRLGFHHLRVLSRGVDTRLFSPQRRSQALRQSWGAKPDDLVVLYAGRLAAEKNIHLAITAFQAFYQKQSRAKLILVGDGPLASTLKVQYPQIIFCGMRQGEDLAAHYASADIFLFPSLTETFGNVTLEAMASGLAVVAFDYAAAHRYIKHGLSGLLVPLGNSNLFIEATQSLARYPTTLHPLGQQARRTAETIDWEHIYRELETIFRELVRLRSRS